MFELFAVTSPWPADDSVREVMNQKTRLMMASQSLREAAPRAAKIAASGAAQWELRLVERVDEGSRERERRLQSAFELASDAGDVEVMKRVITEWDRLGLPGHRRFRKDAELRYAAARREQERDNAALVRALQRTKGSRDPELLAALRLAAETLLEHRGFPRLALPAILHARAEDSDEARRTALECLYAVPLHSPSAVEALRVLLKGPSPALDLVEAARPWLAPEPLVVMAFDAHVTRWRRDQESMPSAEAIRHALAAAHRLPDTWASLRAAASVSVPVAAAEVGAALVDAQRWSDAVAPLQAALESKLPDAIRGPLFNDLGVALARVGRTEEARANFEHAAKLLPEHPTPASNLTLLERDRAGARLATVISLAQFRSDLRRVAPDLAA